MRALAFALVLVATGAACDGGLVAELRTFRDRVCACADKACVDAVHRDFEGWLEANKHAKPTASEMRDLMEVADAYTSCYVKHAAAKAKLPTNLPAEKPEGALPEAPEP